VEACLPVKLVLAEAKAAELARTQRKEKPPAEDGWSVSGAVHAVRRSERRGRELTERIAAIEAQAAWQARWGPEGAETCAQWLDRLGGQEKKQPVLCRSFERGGRCTYFGCRFLHVPPKPAVLLVESRARELEEKAQQSLRRPKQRTKARCAEEASTAASDAGAGPVSEASLSTDAGVTVSESPSLPSAGTIPEEAVVSSEESGAHGSLSTVIESVAPAKRRRALAKKLREIDVLVARGSLTQEERAKVQRREEIERELAELD